MFITFFDADNKIIRTIGGEGLKPYQLEKDADKVFGELAEKHPQMRFVRHSKPIQTAEVVTVKVSPFAHKPKTKLIKAAK